MQPWWKFWVPRVAPIFQFEIVSTALQIRFFITTQAQYSSFLTGQLYAHYSDIEMKESISPLEVYENSDTSKPLFLSREIGLAHNSLETIKLYVNLKDRTEKDSLDPLSGITSALSKIAKEDIGAFIFDFGPVEDSVWRHPAKQHIWKSRIIPDSLRLYMLHFWSWIGWMFLPISVSFRLLAFLLPKSDESSESNSKGESKEKFETKNESFGYAVKIHVVKNAREKIADDLLLKELAGSMNIFANPSGNHFVMKKLRPIHSLRLPKKLPKSAMILSVTELAGLIHLPTLYVKTPGIRWVTTRKFEPPHNLPSTKEPNTPIGMANYR